jgi:acetyltransferase-like isoleucine patch superfamily enzyme
MPIVNCKLGKDVKIVEPVNIYECEIGDGCCLGPFIEVQKSVKIGKNVKIESHSFICEGVTIDDEVFIGHGVVMINDKYPQVDQSKWVLEKTTIKKGTSIGSSSVLLPVTVGEGAMVGAGSVVTKEYQPRKSGLAIQPVFLKK